jgi:hypothetical protein
VVLLQVDERGPVWPAPAGDRTGTRARRGRTPCRRSTARPSADAFAAAQAIEDLQRALRVADRARADADGVVVVEHEHRNAALREIDRRGEADRPAPDDDDRHARAGRRRARAAAVSETGLRDVAHVARAASGALAFERLPHVLVALRGPDARIADSCVASS